VARRVFFSFNYEDVKNFRVNVVRNSGVVQEQDTFIDASLWEKVKKESDLAIKRMINKGLERTTATVVLIGENTYDRRWVRYEIAKSFERGNAIIGIYINNIKDKHQRIVRKGKNPFDYMGYAIEGKNLTLYVKDRFLDLFWFKQEGVPVLQISKIKYILKQKSAPFSSLFPVYDWVEDEGYKNLNKWIEKSLEKINIIFDEPS
jgi:hypothetical protein